MSAATTRTRVLVTVLTYPHPSAKYKELVCTAGVTAAGEWIRLYPVDYRYRPAGGSSPHPLETHHPLAIHPPEVERPCRAVRAFGPGRAGPRPAHVVAPQANGTPIQHPAMQSCPGFLTDLGRLGYRSGHGEDRHQSRW